AGRVRHGGRAGVLEVIVAAADDSLAERSQGARTQVEPDGAEVGSVIDLERRRRGADITLDDRQSSGGGAVRGRHVDRNKPRVVEAGKVDGVILLHVGQNQGKRAVALIRAVGVRQRYRGEVEAIGRQRAVTVVVVVQGQADLLQVVRAADAVGRLAGLL